MLQGFWYEVAYEDVAQIGESCQYYNKTVDPTGGGVAEQFGFTYLKPRHMNLLYTHTDVSAIYTKALSGPDDTETLDSFSQRLKVKVGFQIPTVVVDVMVNPEDGSYETLIEYACFQVGPITYEEIRLGSRTPTVTDATMKAMEMTLQDVGIEYRRLNYVDQKKSCKYA
mmetsp:Transcript_32613/g.54557  ORF Transcript_32613/g.54557 Transcript_32613/m.54557 type:complete len:169 (+) Transcript_32613:215-721(+)